jgi:hypothetical protein
MRALETHNSNHGTQIKLYREVVFFHSLKLKFITEKHRRFGRCFFSKLKKKRNSEEIKFLNACTRNSQLEPRHSNKVIPRGSFFS